MGVIIGILNNKGGVAKTTATINLGHALANRGKRVLVVDMDNQCNATQKLLGTEPTETPTIYNVLKSSCSGEDLPDAASCIYATPYDKLFCLPNHKTTAHLEKNLYDNYPESMSYMRRFLREYAHANYDYCLIDTPPNLGIFVLNALLAADCAIVPISGGSVDSVHGLKNAMRLINEAKESLGPDESLRFLRILISSADVRTQTARSVINAVHAGWGPEQSFKTIIPRTTEFEKAEAVGKTIIRFNPAANASKGYRALAAELISIIDGGAYAEES